MFVTKDGISESYLRTSGKVARCAYDLHVANEAATCVAVAAVIDVGGANEDTACVVAFFLLFLLRSTQMGLTGCSGASEDIERHDAIYKKASAIVRLMGNIVRMSITDLSTTGSPSTSVSLAGS